MQEKIPKGIFALRALFSIFAVLMICFFLLANAIPTITQVGLFDFVFGLDRYPTEGIFGVFPTIVGNIYVTVLVTLIGVPLGVLSVIYLSHFASKKEQKYIPPTVELLGAIPSVVYGFLGLVVIVPLLATTFSGIPGKSVLAMALILNIMILLIITLASKAAIDALPQSYYEGALALGASKERSVFFALIPAAKNEILASIILGVGRAIGEAVAVIMVAGNRALIPASVLEGVRTLTTNIVLEMGYVQDLHREVLIANTVVLLVFILPTNTCSNTLKKEAK